MERPLFNWFLILFVMQLQTEHLFTVNMYKLRINFQDIKPLRIDQSINQDLSSKRITLLEIWSLVTYGFVCLWIRSLVQSECM